MPSHEVDNTAWLAEHDLLPAPAPVSQPCTSWGEVQQLQAVWLSAYRRYVGDASPENEAVRAKAHDAYAAAQSQALAASQRHPSY
jgi:hypothetical protein